MIEFFVEITIFTLEKNDHTKMITLKFVINTQSAQFMIICNSHQCCYTIKKDDSHIWYILYDLQKHVTKEHYNTMLSAMEHYDALIFIRFFVSHLFKDALLCQEMFNAHSKGHH